MNDSIAADQSDAPAATVNAAATDLSWSASVVAAAARVAHVGYSATVVLPRRPGVVDRVRAVARASGVQSTVTIDGGGPTIAIGTVDPPDALGAIGGRA